MHGVLVASNYVRRRFEAGGVPRDIMHVIPYFCPTDVTPMEVPESASQVLFVGRLSETKGVQGLLEAIVRCPSETTLVIAGDGHLRPTLEQHARGLGLDRERVQFIGYVHDRARLRELYAGCALVVVPSLWPEPFGIVGLEALAAGKPVVANDVGGVSEWLEDGRVGLLARPGDVEDLAEKISSLIRQPALRRELGSNGPGHVREAFGWNRHWARFLEVVESAGH
jgi:glycosyltransferase involved in cell wall biosynthesis